MAVSTVIAGRSRFSVNVRYAADYRADPAALRRILVPVTATEPIGEVELGGAGGGASAAVSRRQQAAVPLAAQELSEIVVAGATARVRPILMSVASTVLGLLPLLWEAGPGADVSARIAAPVVGGLLSCLVLTLLVLPAAYAIWRTRQIRLGTLDAAPPLEVAVP